MIMKCSHCIKMSEQYERGQMQYEELQAENKQQAEQIEELLTQQQHTQVQRDRDLNTLNKTQCEVHKAANRANALQAENQRLKEELKAVYSSAPCPKCGYGITGGCYGCEIKRLKEAMEHAVKKLMSHHTSRAGISVIATNLKEAAQPQGGGDE